MTTDTLADVEFIRGGDLVPLYEALGVAILRKDFKILLDFATRLVDTNDSSWRHDENAENVARVVMRNK